jgi:hypothetical protein
VPGPPDVATGEGRPLGVVDVDHVQTRQTHVRDDQAGVAADDVREAGLRVDLDVVGRGGHRVEGVTVPLTRLVDVPEPGEIEDRHAVRLGLAHDERVVGEHLDVVPDLVQQGGVGELAEVDRIGRIGDPEERDAVRLAEDHVLVTAVGVGPAPQIADPGPVELLLRHEREQVDAVTAERASLPVDAGHVGEPLELDLWVHERHVDRLAGEDRVADREDVVGAVELDRRDVRRHRGGVRVGLGAFGRDRDDPDGAHLLGRLHPLEEGRGRALVDRVRLARAGLDQGDVALHVARDLA